MPEFTGINHVSLTVRDLEVSKRWYTTALDLTVLREATRATFARAILQSHEHPSVLGITEHNEGREAAFSELNAGLDHVSFTVASRAALEQWARHLDAAGVAHSGVVDDQFGSRINLRDPDNIQLELVVLRDTD